MSNFQDHEFVKQYAIRMPDSTLFGSRTFSPAEQVMSFGPFSGFVMAFGDDDDEDEEMITTPPTVWYDRDEAERQLQMIRDQMKMLGIEWWGGVIVERLCSPFTNEDPGRFADEITEWLGKQ